MSARVVIPIVERIQRRYSRLLVELGWRKLIIEQRGGIAPDVEIKAIAAKRWCAAVIMLAGWAVDYYWVWEAGEITILLKITDSGSRDTRGAIE